MTAYQALLLPFAIILLVATVDLSSATAASTASLLQKTSSAAFLNPSHTSPLSFTKQQHQHRRRQEYKTQIFAIPGVSSLTPETTSIPHPPSQQTISPQIIAASASATLTYLFLLLTFDRPRGRLIIPDASNSLVIQPSRVPNGGLGLFVSKSYPEGTVLGTYPGVLRPADVFYNTKCRLYPKAVGYSWRFTDSKYVIDPTDEYGDIQNVCFGGSDALSNVAFKTMLSFMRVSTELTRINEPPVGFGGCNVSARENLDKREVVFTLCRDVVAGEELFLDYGLDYDRTGYAPMPSPRNDNGID